MNKKYLLSSDNGYHYHTTAFFDSIEEAVYYFVNEQINEYMCDYKDVTIKEINRPYYDKSSIVVILTIIDVDGYKYPKEVHISEMELIKPVNKYNVKQLNK